MKNDELTKQQAEAVIKALNNAIEQGPWEESNFLKAIGKNLSEIRDNFVLQSNSYGNAQSTASAHFANQSAKRYGQQKVYIQIYSSDGKSMHSWEWIVANLPRQMISRPIYAEEEDVKAIIKTKEHKINEAYVAFYIGENDILQVHADKVPIDKLGKPRLFLKDGTLKLDNIDFFAHISDIYHYSQGRLIKVIKE